MSRKARTCSPSATMSAGISPETIRQNRHRGRTVDSLISSLRACASLTADPRASSSRPPAASAARTASAAGPAVDERSTCGPSRTAPRPGRDQPARARRRRCRPRGRPRAARHRRSGSVDAGERLGRPPRAAPGPARSRSHAAPARARRVAQLGHVGHPRAPRLLRRPRRTVAAQRFRRLGRALAAPDDDRALRLPRHDLVDAELGRRLDRRLVAVALGQRLHEHEARRRLRLERRARRPAASASGPSADGRPGDHALGPQARTVGQVDDARPTAIRRTCTACRPSAPSSTTWPPTLDLVERPALDQEERRASPLSDR